MSWRKRGPNLASSNGLKGKVKAGERNDHGLPALPGVCLPLPCWIQGALLAILQFSSGSKEIGKGGPVGWLLAFL